MTVTNLGSGQLIGLAADTKPTIYPVGTRFFETDTGKTFYYNGSAWVEQAITGVGTGGPPSGTAGGDLTGTYPNPTIDVNKITYAKLQDITATARLLGRITAGAGDTEELTGTQATTLLDLFTSTLKGLVPLSGGGTTNYLRADGTWNAPASGGGSPTGSAGGDLTGSTYPNPTIANDAVSNAKLSNMGANTVKSNATASTADPSDLSIGTNTVLGRVAGNIVASALVDAQIASSTISYSKIQNISATSRILGRITTGAGVIEELTGTQLTTLLDNFTSALKGLVPLSGGGTANFLRADGSWAAPPSGSTLTAGQNIKITGSTIDAVSEGVKYKTKSITNTDSPYTALATDYVLRVDASAGNVVINLPTSVGIAGVEYHIFRTDIAMSTNIITIDANGSEMIGGTPTALLFTGESIRIESDGVDWQVIHRSTPTRHGYYFLKGATANRKYLSLFGYGTNQSLSASTTTATANTLFATPFILSRTTKFDVISFRCTALSTGGSARAGIYYDNGNCYPGALMFDGGAIDTSTGSTSATRDSTITSSLQVFQPGLYWLVWETNSATGQYTTMTVGTQMWTFAGSDPGMATVANAFAYSVAHTFGALPDPYTAGASFITTAPTAAAPSAGAALGLRPI